jgi:hypothetical protein
VDHNDLKEILANPYYAIVITKALSEEHEPLVSEEDWIKANAKLIEEIGAEEWLRRLLDTLRAK